MYNIYINIYTYISCQTGPLRPRPVAKLQLAPQWTSDCSVAVGEELQGFGASGDMGLVGDVDS